MKRALYFISLIFLPCIISFPAHGQVSLGAARIGSTDPVALSEFYKTALGLYELRRSEQPNGNIQITLIFGETEEAAKANPWPEVLITSRSSDDAVEGIAHIVFYVHDIESIMAAVEEAGGILRAKQPFSMNQGNLILKFAGAIDPSGNPIELYEEEYLPE